MRRAALLLLVLACTACRSGLQTPVSFIHVTDPHLFDRADDDAPNIEEEQLSQQAFADFLRAAEALPDTEAKPAFLVVTGDFGVDGVVGEEEAAEKVLADLLVESPVRDVYFVPGNNDVVGESEQPKDLEAMRGIFERACQKFCVRGGLFSGRPQPG